MQFSADNINVKEVVGVRFRAARDESGYSQHDVADAVNCSVRHIGDIENGKAAAESGLLIRCCELFHKDMNYFFSDIVDFSKYRTDDVIHLSDMDPLSEGTIRSLLRILKYFQKILEKRLDHYLNTKPHK